MENSTQHISAIDLSKAYGAGSGLPILSSVSLSIPRGEFVAITGKSGSGKTTLLNLLGTLDVPSAGEILIDGTNLGNLKGDRLADFRRTHIGFIYQMFNLVPYMTAAENIALPLLPYTRELEFDLWARAEQLLDTVGLASRRDHLPGQLSGGEQQRVAIARALINQPGILLADEPTGNLDGETGDEIMALLQGLNKSQNVTLIIVTHDMRMATWADRVLHLKDGVLSE